MTFINAQNIIEKNAEQASAMNPFNGMSNVLDSKFSNVFSIENNRVDADVNPFSQLENVQNTNNDTNINDLNTTDSTYNALPNSVFDASSNQYKAFNENFRDEVSGGLFFNS